MRKQVSLSALVGISVLTALVIFNSCNTRPTDNNGNANYAVSGTVLADANRDSTKALVDLRKNQVRYGEAVLTFNADTLLYRRVGFPVDSVYSLLKGSRLYYGVGRYKLIVADSEIFSDSVSLRLTDTFSITNVIPANRIAQGLRSVSLEWTGSDSTDGYIIAAAPRDSAYKAYGMSLYPATLTTAGTIPPEAFSLSNGVTADTGWYYLYVYSYTGAPDSALTSKLLPVPLPGQLANNISNSGFSGHFGSVRVARRDSVHVVAQ